MLLVCIVLLNAQTAPLAAAQTQPAQEMVALANQTRRAQGLGTLVWDPALATAALQHCQRMAAEGPIAHRYGGEPDLTARAGDAGAHFSLIEENVAVGASAASIHQAWMESPGHRANLLNAEIDRVGIAVVAARGVLYAVADYTRGVPVLTAAQVEAQVAGLIRARGIELLKDPTDARAACALDRGWPALTGAQPGLVFRWQGNELTQLPQELAAKIASGHYRQAAVGSCPPQDVEGQFTVYRLAVLLY
jgi:hypothetical protein